MHFLVTGSPIETERFCRLKRTRRLRELATRVVCATATAVLLAACGGGSSSSPDDDSGLQAVPDHVTVKVVDSVPGGPSIVAMNRLSERRVSRTVFEYQFSVTVDAGTAARRSIQAELADLPQGSSVVDGRTSTTALAANTRATSIDTVTILHDRSKPFNPELITWRVSAVDAAATASSASTLAAVGLTGYRVT